MFRFDGRHRHFSFLFLMGFLVPGIAVADDAVEERIGRGKINSSFHYFTEVEYAYREVGLERGVWDSRKAGLKDLTARFGIRHLPKFIQRIAPKFDGHLEYFLSATAEQLRQESIYKGAPWPTTDIVHTGLSSVIGLGLGANNWGPGPLLLRTRLEVRYGEYKKVSYSRRFAGNEYDVQADISVFIENIDFEMRYQLGRFEPFLAYNRYYFSLDLNLIYPTPCVGTNGTYSYVGKNLYGLAVGTWIKLKPDISLRLARHFFNQDTYTIQTEMRF